MRTGSEAEKVGATTTWYFARPPVEYAEYASWEERAPTPESKAAVEALSDLRDCYRDAVLAAFLSCEDPGVRLSGDGGAGGECRPERIGT
ncbi:hypothetical protein [Streptomyces mirabilis]|uniref:hypothetical protein n=1 Tax=Streptomyces mirabilis TaxID=68239 RepID=UPI0036DBC517